MSNWVMSFVGDHARDNFESVRRGCTFHVSSNRTPARKALPGDQALFYMAGEGFVGAAEVSEAAAAPGEATDWSSKNPPLWAIPVTRMRAFPESIPYTFPKDGPHPVLGFHRYALTGGFLAIPDSGFEDVLKRVAATTPATEIAEDLTPEPPVSEPPVSEPPVSELPVSELPVSEPPVLDLARFSGERERKYEKRDAGQHALAEGRKRTALWTVAEMGASLFGLKRVERHAQEKVRAAERTWISGGRAEEAVGAELGKLRAHGYYVFHDLPLPGLGNVDHVVLGETGFFCIETKSHKGRVTSAKGELSINGRSTGKDFIKQTWRGTYRLREILAAEVAPILLFSNAFVEGRISCRGVRVLPLTWLVHEILSSNNRHDLPTVKTAVNDLTNATGCYPSATPHA